MSLLYRTLRPVLRLAVEMYFVDIQSAGLSNIPTEGPMIFAANHPNSIMDTVVLGSRTDRQISYMARSGLFNNPLTKFVFDRVGVIPVYRSPTPGASNEDAFRMAYKVLEEGGCIGIFPEGRNSREREVLEIKTGTARIALGACKGSDYDLDIKIIPVGLNFENRDRFLSRVLVRFGPPISVKDWAKEHKLDERAAARSLTAKILGGIREAATHIEGFQVIDIVRDVDEIYGQQLLRSVLSDREEEKRLFTSTFDDLRVEDLDDDPIVADIMEDDNSRSLRKWFVDEVKSSSTKSTKNLDERFWLLERIALALKYYQDTDPAMVDEMKRQIWRYKDHLRQVRLRHEFLDRPPDTLSLRREALRFTTYAFVFGLPALWGFLHNIVPFALTDWSAGRAPDEAMRAFTGLLSGITIFGVWYTLFGWLVWMATNDPFACSVYVASLPIAGFFSLRYQNELSRYRGRILTRTLFQTEERLIRGLQAEREDLIADFERLRLRFLADEEAGLVDKDKSEE